MSKVAGYNINIQKSVVFLYINNELSEREIKKTIPITITSRRIKYLGINLTKEAKDLYTEICKTLIKENKDTNKWKDILCSWIGRILLKRLTIQSNLQIQCNPYNGIFHRNRTNNPNIFMES